jgi:hypothetical protein
MWVTVVATLLHASAMVFTVSPTLCISIRNESSLRPLVVLAAYMIFLFLSSAMWIVANVARGEKADADKKAAAPKTTTAPVPTAPTGAGT